MPESYSFSRLLLVVTILKVEASAPLHDSNVQVLRYQIETDDIVWSFFTSSPDQAQQQKQVRQQTIS
jgi:hypothetical protein